MKNSHFKNLLKETTLHQYRLRLIQDQPGPVWLFLPGGPGLGSEYLESLMAIIELRGSVYLVDFPGDGSNPTPFLAQKWKEQLIKVVQSFKQVHLFAHSFASMFVLTCPELESYLESLVLMSASAKKLTHHSPGPIDLKHYFLSRLHLYVLPETLERATKLFENLPYNDKAFLWARDYFHPTYQPLWVPQKIPTLIFTGDKDQITPLSSFEGTSYLNRANITFQSIAGASHFPWLEKPQEVTQVMLAMH